MKKALKAAWLLVHVAACALTRTALRSSRAAGARRSTDRVDVHFVVHDLWGLGGAVRAVTNVAGHLSSEFDVHLVSVVRHHEDPAFPLPAQCDVLVLDDRRPGARPGRLQAVLGRLPSVLVHPRDWVWGDYSLWTDLQLLRWLRATRFGVIICTRPSLNLMAARFARPETPVIGQEHIAFDDLPRLLRREMLRQYPRLDVVTPLTDHDLRTYAAVFAPHAPRLQKIPNAVTPLAGEPAAVREHVVVGAGRLRPRKGFDLLLRAFAPVARQHPDWRLVVYGRGSEQAALERLAAELGVADRVSFPGVHRSIGEPFARSAVFALSSRVEGFPLVLLEAMSKGAAVVAFDCPTGPGEILTDGVDGHLVPPQDVETFSGRLLRLVEDEDARRRLGANAMATSRRYALPIIGAQWRELILSLLTPSRQQSAEAGEA